MVTVKYSRKKQNKIETVKKIYWEWWKYTGNGENILKTIENNTGNFENIPEKWKYTGNRVNIL